MPEKKTAAILPDRIVDTPISELTAADFLEALSNAEIAQAFQYWPEKKKYELEVDFRYEGLNLGDIVLKLKYQTIQDKIRPEVDLSKYLWPGHKNIKKEYEFEPEKFIPLGDPPPFDIATRFDQLVAKIDRLADAIKG